MKRSLAGGSSLSEVRSRLRRLCESAARLRGREGKLEKDLRTCAGLLASRMSLLSVRSGAASGELFRASSRGVKFETTDENEAGVSCLQLRASSLTRGGNPRLTSFLTSPQTDEIEQAVSDTAAALCLYANVRLRLARVEGQCRRLRSEIAQGENEPSANFRPSSPSRRIRNERVLARRFRTARERI